MKKIEEKNQEILARATVPAEEIFAKQESKKAVSVNAALNKHLETDEEYDARLAEIRKKDFVNTRELKLRNIEIPGHKTMWASTDPKAKPSIIELKSRGYRIVNDVAFVPTESHSVEGAGFHILMCIPDDIADKRKEALSKRAKEDMDKVFQKKIESQDSKKDYLYQENRKEAKID